MPEQPLQTLRLDHVVLRCTDLKSMLKFYRDVLGCTLERSVESLGLYQLRAGEALVDLVPVGTELGGDTAPQSERFNMAHFCLRVDIRDWDSVRTHLETHHITWQTPQRRYGADGFGESVYIQDPEGNTVELKGPPTD